MWFLRRVGSKYWFLKGCVYVMAVICVRERFILVLRAEGNIHTAASDDKLYTCANFSKHHFS